MSERFDRSWGLRASSGSSDAERPLALAVAVLLALAACGPPGPARVAAVAAAPLAPEPASVAITFDDLPAHGPLGPGDTHLQVHRDLVRTLNEHGMTNVFGFINGSSAKVDPEARRVLELWLAAGQRLGNHTFTHANLNAMSVAEFTEDIALNDALLSELVGSDPSARAQRRTFRYPYLREGRDVATIDAVRSYLAQNEYRIAEVTIDFGDWAYNAPYARCAARNDRRAIEHMKRDFVQLALDGLAWSTATAKDLYARPIRHILVLHTGSFDALVLEELLSAYEHAGVQWIGLDAALLDDVYREDVRVPAEIGVSLLERRLQRDRGGDPSHLAAPAPPMARLEALCR